VGCLMRNSDLSVCPGFIKSAATILVVSTLFSCSEQRPTNSITPEQVADTNSSQASITNRAVEAERLNSSLTLEQVFGPGFTATSNSPTSMTAPIGFVGNAGGFGFGGSIASVIGNVGGFGFGGFGAFSSFFAGSLPTAPPNGVLLPAQTAPSVPANTNTANSVENENKTPTLITGGVSFSTTTNQNSTNSTSSNVSSTLDSNLGEFDSALNNSALDFVFVAPPSQTATTDSVVSPLALSEVVTPCVGGGSMQRALDDVEPVGFSTGDTRTTSYLDCIRSAGSNIILNGSRGFIANQIDGAPFVDLNWSMMTTTFQDNMSRADIASGVSRVINGSTTTGITVFGNNVSQIASGSGSVIRVDNTGSKISEHQFELQFDWDTATQAYRWMFNVSVTVNMNSVQSTIQAETGQIFTGVFGQAPVSGSLKVIHNSAGVMSSIMVLNAQPGGTVLIETDNNADGVVDSAVIEPSWDNALWQVFNKSI